MNQQAKIQKQKKNLTVSFDIQKILFFHYFFDERSAGVNRVIQNNIEGLKLFYPNLNPILVAENFEDNVLKGYEKRKIDLSFNLETLINDISEISRSFAENFKDANIISGHNILRGINPAVSGGFKNFSEISDKLVEYRNHDFVMRYANDYKKMLLGVENFGDWFPKNPEVIQSTLTSSTRCDMEIFFGGDIGIMRNSIIYDDLTFKNNKKDENLKELFLEENIFEPGMKNVIYAVRADERKNIEEALFITSVLKHVTGKPHKLIVTASREKDYPDPKDNKYQRNIEKFAETFNIPYSIGEAYKHVDGINFDIGNLYRAGDVAITTAIKEGFGYSFVEPWIAYANKESKEKYVLGRWIREVCEDFENNGMKLKETFYDSSTLYSKGNSEKRMHYFAEILGDKKIFKKFVKRVDLESRIDSSKKYLHHNAETIKKVYGHDVVAKDLAKLYNLPNHENIKI